MFAKIYLVSLCCLPRIVNTVGESVLLALALLFLFCPQSNKMLIKRPPVNDHLVVLVFQLCLLVFTSEMLAAFRNDPNDLTKPRNLFQTDRLDHQIHLLLQ